MDFPDLELERLKKELAECKAKVQKYERILQEHELMDAVPSITVAEEICLSQLEKYNDACKKGAVLTLEETKIVDFMVKNLLLARGKQVPVEDKRKKKKEEPVDIAKLLQIAGGKEE